MMAESAIREVLVDTLALTPAQTAQARAMTDDETNGNGGGNEERIDLVRSMKAVPAP